MAERYRDFDAFTAEKQGEPIRFKMRGQEFELPPSIPAAVGLAAVRLRAKYGDNIDQECPQEELIELATGLFGKPNLDRLLETGLSVDEFNDVLMWVFSAYSGTDTDQGNPAAPPAAGE